MPRTESALLSKLSKSQITSTTYSGIFFIFSTYLPTYGLSTYSNLTDQDAAHLRITLQEKSDITEEVLTEVSVFFGMLYHLIEIFKGYDDFADELSEYFIITQWQSSSYTKSESEFGSAPSGLSFQFGFKST